MLTKKEALVYFLLCLFTAFVQAASQVFQHYGKTLMISGLLYFLFGIIVQVKFPGIRIWQLFLSIVPYLLIIAVTEFHKEDIPVIIGIVTGLGLSILVYRSNLHAFLKAMIALFWLSGLLYFAFWKIPEREIAARAFEMNKQLPAFTLLNAKAKKITSDQWKGKVVLIDLWYTKCGLCLRQFPSTQRIHELYRNNPDVVVCAVNCGYDPLQTMNSFTSRFPYTFPYFLDTDTTIGKSLNLAGFPRTLVLDRTGKIRFRVEGFSPEWEKEYEDKVISTINSLAKE